MPGKAEIQLKAEVDAAIAALKRVDNELGATSGKIKTHQKVVKDLDVDWKGLLRTFGVTATIAGAGKAVEKLFSDWQKYTLDIGDLAAKLGTTTEEASALSEMAGDLGVSMGSLEMGFKRMAMNGIEPSMAGLAEVKKRLEAARTPAEKLAMAQELLGRAGADLIPVFQQLSEDQLRNYINTMKDGQIVTAAEVAIARKNRDELDALGDTWTNLKLTVGGALAGTITPALERMNAVLEGDLNLWGAWADLLRNEGVDALGTIGDAILRIPDHIESARGSIELLKQDLSPEALAVIAENVEAAFGQPLENAAGGIDALKDSIANWGREAIITAGVTQLFNDAIAVGGISAEETKAMMGLLNGDLREKMLPTLAESISNFNTAAGEVDAVGRALSLLPPLTELEVVTYFREVHGGGGKSTITTSWGTQHERRQYGGPLAPITEVGERGTEGIIGNVVIPHDEWERMKRLGLMPTERMASGGYRIDGLVVPGGPVGKSGSSAAGGYYVPPISYGANPMPSTAPFPGIAGGDQVLQTAASAATQAAVEAAGVLAQATAGAVGAQIPTAVSLAVGQQAGMQAQLQSASTEKIVASLGRIERELRNLPGEIARSTRDAVQQVI